jgi:hypothetical protein
MDHDANSKDIMVHHRNLHLFRLDPGGEKRHNSPRGMTNFVIDSRHPKSMAHCMVTGIVAAELEVPKPMAKAGKKALSSQNRLLLLSLFLCNCLASGDNVGSS